MLVEFFGLPGAGKTFLCLEFIRRNNSCGKNLTELSRTKTTYKVLFRWYRFLVKHLPKYRHLIDEIESVLDSYRGIYARYNTCSIDRYIESIVLDAFLIDRYSKKQSLFFLDEGIVQQYINIVVNYKVDKEDLLKVIQLIQRKSICVSIDVSVEDSIRSIEKRNRHTCYIDELTGRKQEEFLRDYLDAFLWVRELFPGLLLKRENDLEVNCGKITEYIRDKKV